MWRAQTTFSVAIAALALSACYARAADSTAELAGVAAVGVDGTPLGDPARQSGTPTRRAPPSHSARGSAAGSPGRSQGKPIMHRAIVAGSTGGVGRRVVRALALDPRVERVTALARPTPTPRDAASLFDLADDPAALSKVVFAPMKYDELLATGTGAEAFQGHTLGVSCLGIYTRDAKDEAHFRRVEIEYNVAAAQALVAGGGRRMAYLSGMGAKKGGWAMFARVKADAEEALRLVPGMEKAASMRPGAILNREGGRDLGFQDTLAHLLAPVMSLFGAAVETDDIAKAMLYATMHEPAGDVADVYENDDIKAAARVYEQEVALVAADRE